jgi:hypothetical protein
MGIYTTIYIMGNESVVFSRRIFSIGVCIYPRTPPRRC